MVPGDLWAVVCVLPSAWNGSVWSVAGGGDLPLPVPGVWAYARVAGCGVRDRWLYPPNWDEMARACKQRAGWQCEFCGVPHGTPAVSERTGVVYTIYLAAAHLDHDPWNAEPQLAALCPSCHARYDYSWRERERRVALEQYRHRLWLDRWLSSKGEP